MKFKCAWCGDDLRTQRIIGIRNNSLKYIDGYDEKEVYKNQETKEFCSMNCRAEYYFGM